MEYWKMISGVTEKEEGNAGRAENVKKTVHNALLLLSRLLEEG